MSSYGHTHSKKAQALIHYSLAVKAGERVLLRAGSPAAEPLVQALYQEVLKVGAHPLPYIHLRHEESLALEATDDPDLLATVNPMLKLMFEESVNGWVNFTYPAFYGGNEVNGIRLGFKEGLMTEASAEHNEAFLISLLDTDAGARRLGEFAIGTNSNIQRFTGATLFDEKIGGTVHMAVGQGFPQTGSVNTSAIHWDMVCDMRDGGEILVDGERFYQNGKFTV